MRRVLAHILTLVLGTITAVADPPTIAFFYGKHQTFRNTGVPQRCANVLGNVQDADGISALTFSVNGGVAKSLSRGPDGRRLLSQGDFNIDIPWKDLLPLPDSNIVAVTAADNLSETLIDTVIVSYVPDTQWPFPTSLSWSGHASVLSAAQPVDGRWAIEGSGVHPLDLGYDRLIAIGDTTWTDYEVTVPITIHSIDAGGYNVISGRPVVGVFVRWVGHTDDPISGWQPLSGWNPSGALGMYAFNTTAQGGERLEIWQNVFDTSGKQLALDNTYYFKMRVESQAGGDHYALRVWPDGETEPSTWDLMYLDVARRASRGSALLLAHHVDATFGTVQIGIPSPLPVQLAEFTGTVLSMTSVRLFWRTLGETSNYGFEVERAAGEPVNYAPIPGSFVPGYGTTIEPHEYSYVDSNAHSGILYYRLKQIDLDGTFTYHEGIRAQIDQTAAVQAPQQTPHGFALQQNYPNPFNAKTVISGQLSAASKVRSAVYDLLGREVALLVDEQKQTGPYEVRWDASAMPSGVYVCRIEAGGYVDAKRMLLLK